MPRVLHIVTTTNFAGVERYVCDVANESARRGWEVVVIGGREPDMLRALGEGVGWRPGGTPYESFRSIRGAGQWDVCHVHMTTAEALGILTRHWHRAPILSTRHFAAPRGSSHVGRVLAPWIASRTIRELAVSEFVAESLEQPPAAVVLSGVLESPCVWSVHNRVVLMLQRLEREKDTITALRGWRASRLAGEGWSLRIVGEGSERETLEEWVLAEGVEGVTFAGWVSDVRAEFSRAGAFLAAAPAEPFGLAVVEAMAAGVPVVACGSGGHAETVGRVTGAPLFARGDPEAAGLALRKLRSDSTRIRLSAVGRDAVAKHFRIEEHVDRLAAHYESICKA